MAYSSVAVLPVVSIPVDVIVYETSFYSTDLYSLPNFPHHFNAIIKYKPKKKLTSTSKYDTCFKLYCILMNAISAIQ